MAPDLRPRKILDSVPHGYCGVAIIGDAGAVIVETIAGGVFSDAPAERRRERTIQQLHDHFIKISAPEHLFAPRETVAG
jgi:hypothetical protein